MPCAYWFHDAHLPIRWIAGRAWSVAYTTGRFVAMDFSRRPYNAPRRVTRWQLVCLRTFAPPRASFRSRKYESKGFTGQESCLVLYEVRVKGIVELGRDEVQDAFFSQQSETLHLREHTLHSNPSTNLATTLLGPFTRSYSRSLMC